jgi:hypothetical protein
MFLAFAAAAIWLADHMKARRGVRRALNLIVTDISRQQQFLRDLPALRAYVERSLSKADAEVFVKEVEGWTYDRRRRALEVELKRHAKRTRTKGTTSKNI